ncbi:putative phospholipase B-like lamina ancestor isoform X1 [Helicoverpa zea]|uniref:putative phospholipase B-like lamina ancestor isoform X1 n=1 Tax=Helicoverpa zea TaxID=7113 RepID=UPI001F57AE2D|nr:putative phospholipase B-like lamina ancestor isoform X1 [Helicoverpa zea]XP_047029874.1 putative phospholipase B-like lamina ancestor isoform X1 [Helicoverpa zea]
MSKILKVVGASWLQTKISSYILGILGILSILALFVGQIERIQEDGNYAATVFFSNKTGYRIEYWGQSNELADIPRGVARAYFRMDIDTTGWSLLEIETDPSYSDDHQAYAAGIVEGALTWSLIHSHLENTIRAKCDESPSVMKQCNKFRDTLDKSVDIWKAHAAEKGGDDPFWHHVSLHYIQISGILTGWKHGIDRSMKEYETDISDLYWLNSVSEAIEIQRKMNISLEDEALETVPHLSSAFLRVADDKTKDGIPTKKLYVSQNAAGSYASMTRILKKYKLNYHETAKDSKLVPGTSVHFSGYPGSITSQDEFYVVKGDKHRLAVTGTTLRNYNHKLWKEVNITEQVPVGPRVSAANHLATNVSSWGHIMATSNSGTACKQWLIVDFNRFDHLHTLAPRTEVDEPNEVVTESTLEKDVRHIVVYRNNNVHSKGLLSLVEQVPGRTHSADLSDAFLEQGYWATYGLPFFKDIAEITHVNKMEEKYGNIFSESESPRALLFKLGHTNATTLDSIISLMRQNNMTEANSTNKEDIEECSGDVNCILSERGYWSVVGVRGDITSLHREAFGVIDTKVVSGALNETNLDIFAVSGPPYTEIQPNATKILLNKGNIAPIYTELLNDKPDINGIEIRDLVLHEQEKAEEDKLELLNKDLIKPFDWSESEFKNASHQGLPDRWAFSLYSPKWTW